LEKPYLMWHLRVVKIRNSKVKNMKIFWMMIQKQWRILKNKCSNRLQK